MNITLKLLLAFTLMLFLIILVGFVSIVNLSEVSNNYKFLVVHDLNVLQNAQYLQKLVIDAETGQRGFIITGNEKFLEPYSLGVIEFYELIQIEKKLVSDEPAQLERLEMIEILFDKWNTNAAIPEINLARKVHTFDISTNDLENLLVEGTGKKILEELHVLIDIMLIDLINANQTEYEKILREISKDLLERESGQRGFLITGEEEFLDSYNLATRKLNTHLAELIELVQKEEIEIANVQKLVFLTQSWEINAGTPEIEIRKLINANPKISDVALLIESGTGKDILDDVRSKFVEFIKIENELNHKRFQTTLEIESNTQIIIILTVLFSIVLTIAILILILHTFIRPIRKLESASYEITKGNLDIDIEHKGNDEISNLTKSFNIMKNSIKENIENEKIDSLKKVKNERLTSIGELSARISHDIRNPLSVINNDFFLLTKEHPELDQDAVHRIERGIDRINHQVEGVLNFVRKNIPELEKVMFSEIISDSSTSLTIPDNVELILPKNDVELFCDKKHFSVVMHNLLLNGIQAIDDDVGTIEITCDENDDNITIQIKNSGKTISKEHIDKIFEPLFTTKQQGTGLGLASVKSIIDIHGGTISVTSPPVIFTIILPKSQ